MRIGIYGGAFNPVHKGHVKLAEEVKTKAHLDKIIIMPSGVSPHKSSGELLDSEHRSEMCRLAFEGEDYIISDLEIKREGKSYTVDTVAELKKLYPDSYPISFRSGHEKFSYFCTAWQPYMEYLHYYDYTDNTWKYGCQQPIMKDVVVFWNHILR